MQKLIQGVHKFQGEVFGQHRELFGKLSKGQWPKTLFLTCSDSRIDPSLLTQTEPGDLFIVRNAGNIVPCWHGDGTAEAAAIEFALVGLGVEEIVICGHSMCGAMKGLLNLDGLGALPTVRSWLRHAESARRVVVENYTGLSPDEQLNVVIQENVLTQLEQLRTHPAVASRLAAGKLHLHGWVYKIETGDVFAFDPGERQFLPLAEAGRPAMTARPLALAP